MASSKQKLVAATNLLSKYYGLPVLEDLLSAESLKNVTGRGTSSGVAEEDKLLDTIVANFINSSSGALTSAQLVEKFNTVVSQNPDAIERINKVFQIFFHENHLITGTTVDLNEESREKSRVPIKSILEYEGDRAGLNINGNASSPSKTSPSLSVIFCNSPRIGLTGRDINSVVIFLNGIPNIEINRAVPFVNIEFSFPRPAINEGQGGRLQTLSMAKFLLGAEKIDTNNQPLAAIAQAGQVTQAGSDDIYSTAGMELFTSPQSLVNADMAVGDPSLHSAEILDKFKPLMTLQSLNIEVAPSTGLMSFKTADLKFVLHDRSRLAEIAEFVRADLYGSTELMIEYGWSHPDGQAAIGTNNPYGDLINGMRVKEKYGVINSSFTFDEVGQVVVSLELFTRGAVDFDTELIASDSESVASVLKEIEELQKLIGDYREKMFSSTAVARSKEIRGIQILDAAQDAAGQVSAGKKLRDEMNKFRKELKNSKNASAAPLIEALDKLFGSKGNDPSGLMGDLRKKISDSINKKMLKLQAKGRDPFLIKTAGSSKSGDRNIKAARGKTKRQEAIFNKQFKNISGITTGTQVSLAKILLNFVAEPLANTQKFDDIQFVFYPFNSYAGSASFINIGNFAVDLKYFTEEYQQYRLGHVSKSGNMNLSDFLEFLGKTILDDPMARSYGLFDDDGGFYKNVYNEDNTERSAQIDDNAPNFQARLEKKLAGVTPDGSFKMPVIEFFIEGLTEAVGENDGEDSSSSTSRTILRVHIFDKQSTRYDTLQALLASTRDAEIEAINSAPTPPPSETSNESVVDEKERTNKAILAAAEASNLIEPIRSDEKDLPTKYRITGSPSQLKDFMMRTMPYVIYGTAGTTIKAANLSSMQNSKLSTIHILRSANKSELQPNGENPGGLPLRIIPTELTLVTMGCPLVNFAQQFFCDFQTGTTADAIYAVVGLSHAFSPGEFTTDIKMTPLDGWGRYMSLVQRVGQAAEILKDIEKNRQD